MFDIVLAGLIQGFLEWLPVSSSGNVALLFMRFIGSSPLAAVRLALSLHLATAFAASTYYYRFVANALRNPLGLEARILLMPLITGAPIGYFLYQVYEETVSRLNLEMVMMLIGVLLIVTGSILLAQGRIASGAKSIGEISLRDLLVLGIVEGVAVLPGLSRSGLVSAYMLLRGYNPAASIKTAFVTGISSTLLAALYIIYSRGVAGGDAIGLLLGFISAYAAGLVSLGIIDILAEKMVRNIGLFLLVYGSLVVVLHLASLLA